MSSNTNANYQTVHVSWNNTDEKPLFQETLPPLEQKYAFCIEVKKKPVGNKIKRSFQDMSSNTLRLITTIGCQGQLDTGRDWQRHFAI